MAVRCARCVVGHQCDEAEGTAFVGDGVLSSTGIFVNINMVELRQQI